MIKNLPAMQETWVRSLGLEDPQEKGMATHSSILAWRISWTEEPDGLQSMGSLSIGKRILHVQGQRRSPNKTVGGVKSHLESNPIPARNAWRAQTKLYVHQDPEVP